MPDGARRTRGTRVLGLRVLGLGAGLTALVTAVEWFVWGSRALVPAIAFGLVATAIQLAAIRTLKPALAGPPTELVKHFAVGMGLRLVGIVLFLGAVLADRVMFPPLPSALGYLGVVVPLLFWETKLSK